MKLLELTGYKKYTTLTLDGLIQSLRGKQGFFGAVVTAKDSKYVYKIWVKDPGYERWLKQVEKHQSNPFFPKIIKGKKEVKLPLTRDANFDTINIVRLEHLTPFNYGTDELVFLCNFLASLNVSSLKSAILEAFETVVELSTEEGSKVIKKYSYSGSKSTDRFGIDERIAIALYCITTLGYSKKDFIELINVIDNVGDYDIKPDNIMMRSYHQMVITDPYGSSNDAVTISDISVDYDIMSRLAPDLVARGLKHLRKA